MKLIQYTSSPILKISVNVSLLLNKYLLSIFHHRYKNWLHLFHKNRHYLHKMAFNPEFQDSIDVTICVWGINDHWCPMMQVDSQLISSRLCDIIWKLILTWWNLLRNSISGRLFSKWINKVPREYSKLLCSSILLKLFQLWLQLSDFKRSQWLYWVSYHLEMVVYRSLSFMLYPWLSI